MDTPAKAFLIEALEPLCGPLHEILPSAADVAENHFAEFDMTDAEYRTGRSHLARCHARRLLTQRSREELGGWRVTTPGQNTRLWLVRDALKLRLLRPLPGRNVPPPGPNHARIAYYSNHHTNLLGVAGSELIALWDIEPKTGEANIRVVRTYVAWAFGGKTKVDIDFTLPHPPARLSDLEFRPTDDLDLTLPEEDEGEEGGNADSTGR